MLSLTITDLNQDVRKWSSTPRTTTYRINEYENAFLMNFIRCSTMVYLQSEGKVLYMLHLPLCIISIIQIRKCYINFHSFISNAIPSIQVPLLLQPPLWGHSHKTGNEPKRRTWAGVSETFRNINKNKRVVFYALQWFKVWKNIYKKISILASKSC